MDLARIVTGGGARCSRRHEPDRSEPYLSVSSSADGRRGGGGESHPDRSRGEPALPNGDGRGGRCRMAGGRGCQTAPPIWHRRFHRPHVTERFGLIRAGSAALIGGRTGAERNVVDGRTARLWWHDL